MSHGDSGFSRLNAKLNTAKEPSILVDKVAASLISEPSRPFVVMNLRIVHRAWRNKKVGTRPTIKES